MGLAVAGIFAAILTGVLAFVGLFMAQELRRTWLHERRSDSQPRLDRNDSLLWSAVFGDEQVLNFEEKDSSGDPVSSETRSRLYGNLQTAVDPGGISFGERSRGLRVLSCEPAEGNCDRWNARRFSLRDAAGHRFALLASFLVSDRDRNERGEYRRTALRESEGTQAFVHLEGIAVAENAERQYRRHLAAMEDSAECHIPWDTGISR